MLTELRSTLTRLVRKRPGFLALNVLGLAVGMASCLLIGLFVHNELSYDRFHEQSDRIYRVVQYEKDDDDNARIGDAAIPILKEEIPGVASIVRVLPQSATLSVETPDRGRITVEESKLVYASASLFEVFDFPLRSGTASDVLAEPARGVLSASAATKYFGDRDPVGKTLTLNDERQITITGVMEDLPANSHLQFDVALSFGTYYTNIGYPADAIYGSFWWPGAWTYVLMEEGTSMDGMNANLDAAVDANRRQEVAEAYDAAFQPLTDIHLRSEGMQSGVATRGDLGNVYVFGAIALFILVIACINFVNLATAQAVERAKEVGVRKSLGAAPGSLVRQFLTEALMVSTLAAVVALVLTWVGQPILTTLLGRDLAVGIFSNPLFWGGVLFVILVTGLGAGSYPAFFLARYRPADVLKDAGVRGQSRGKRLRQGLVVFQFAVSVALIVAAVVVYQQLNYMQTADLGFEEEQVVTVELDGQYPLLKDEMQRQPQVRAVTAATGRPGIDGGGGLRYELNGERPPNEEERLGLQSVDFGFFDVMDVDVLAGRTFQSDMPSDLGRTLPRDESHFSAYTRDRALVINRAMADKFGWTPEEAIDERLRFYTIENQRYYADVEGRIIGVVEDYHTQSLRQEIEPMAFQPSRVLLPSGNGARETVSTMIVKVGPGQASDVMQALEETWSLILPNTPFNASFLDETLDNLYEQERRVSQLVAMFSLLAVLVACLGLFALATYTVQQRTREVGIRKALGASVPSIVRLVSKDFLKLVGVAVLVAAPVAYYLMGQWLEDFAYRIDLGALPVTIAAIAAVVIALLTVSTQALRAARVDPAQTLRQE